RESPVPREVPLSTRSIAQLSSVLCVVALVTTACSIGKPVPQATTYIVEPGAPERLSSAHGTEVVHMGNVRLAAAFAGSSLIYRTDDVTFVSDPYQAFIADPSAML